jgi:hypothetical protein
MMIANTFAKQERNRRKEEREKAEERKKACSYVLVGSPMGKAIRPLSVGVFEGLAWKKHDQLGGGRGGCLWGMWLVCVGEK